MKKYWVIIFILLVMQTLTVNLNAEDIYYQHIYFDGAMVIDDNYVDIRTMSTLDKMNYGLVHSQRGENKSIIIRGIKKGDVLVLLGKPKQQEENIWIYETQYVAQVPDTTTTEQEINIDTNWERGQQTTTTTTTSVKTIKIQQKLILKFDENDYLVNINYKAKEI